MLCIEEAVWLLHKIPAARYKPDVGLLHAIKDMLYVLHVIECRVSIGSVNTMFKNLGEAAESSGSAARYIRSCGETPRQGTPWMEAFR